MWRTVSAEQRHTAQHGVMVTNHGKFAQLRKCIGKTIDLSTASQRASYFFGFSHKLFSASVSPGPCTFSFRIPAAAVKVASSSETRATERAALGT